MALTQEQAALLYQNIIDLRGEVNEAMTAYVRDCLPVLAINDYPDITIWITSTGGDLYEGLNIYDMLYTYPALSTGVVINRADSMAAIILQACGQRLAHPNAKLLIHDPIISCLSISTLNNGRKLRKALRESDRRIFSRIYTILSQRCKHSLEEIKKKCHEDEEMFADEALEFGLLDGLVS